MNPSNLEQIRSVLSQKSTDLLQKQHVVATGIGYKVKEGKLTEEASIICSVDKKVPLSSLSETDLVPSSLSGIVTDVVETGKIRTFQAPTNRFRPAPGGVSIGHIDITAGTLGCVVKRNGQRVILSNNHVMANSNAASIGDPILQAGPFDGGRFPNDHIANLEDFIPIVFPNDDDGGGGEEDSNCSIAGNVASFLNQLAKMLGSTTYLKPVRKIQQVPQQAVNRVDAAIALPINDNDVLDEILTIGNISGVGQVELGMPIKKMGRTTGFTEGVVSQIEVTSNVNFGSGQIATFTGQIMAGAMSAGGDSGSAVLNASNNQLIGLLFAGSDTTTLMNPIDEVFSALNLTL